MLLPKSKKISVLLLIILFPLFYVCAQDRSPRKELNFNTNWAFRAGEMPGAYSLNFDDSRWAKVSIPHVMRIEKKDDGGGQVYQGIGWYRRYFKLPAVYKDKRITIHFEGIQMGCQIYLNGEKIREHFGAYTGFTVDITDKVKLGKKSNVLAIKVSNLNDPHTPPGKPMSGLDFNYYGGIYRNVSLLVTNKVFISDPLEVDKIAGGGLFVTFPAVS
jgi:beta-galactosidase/beta-glucuronidase